MRNRKTAPAGASHFRPLVLSGLMMMSGSIVQAQNSPSNAGDAPKVPTGVVPPGQGANVDRRENAGREAGVTPTPNPGADPGSRLLIAHGLEMAIEGSTLQALAMDPGTPTGGPAMGTAGTPGTNSPGQGFTGFPGETVSGRPVSTPATGTGSAKPGGDAVRRAEPGTLGLPTPNASGPTGPAPGPTTPATGGSPASMLGGQATRSFQAGNDLLGQANPAPGPEQNFHQAALMYAATLKGLGTRPTAPATAGSGLARPAGLPESRPVGSPAPSTIGANELASIALINHSVKEAIGALRIKQMVGPMGSSGNPAAQKLLAHARQMDAEGRSAIRAINGSVVPGGVVQALAQQADQLIMAMQALQGEPGR